MDARCQGGPSSKLRFAWNHSGNEDYTNGIIQDSCGNVQLLKASMDVAKSAHEQFGDLRDGSPNETRILTRFGQRPMRTMKDVERCLLGHNSDAFPMRLTLLCRPPDYETQIRPHTISKQHVEPSV